MQSGFSDQRSCRDMGESAFALF